jgi:hypothetical protein
MEASEGVLTISNGGRRKRGILEGFLACSAGVGIIGGVQFASNVELGELETSVSSSSVINPRVLGDCGEGMMGNG